jgi:hypothetical protein
MKHLIFGVILCAFYACVLRLTAGHWPTGTVIFFALGIWAVGILEESFQSISSAMSEVKEQNEEIKEKIEALEESINDLDSRLPRPTRSLLDEY